MLPTGWGRVIGTRFGLLGNLIWVLFPCGFPVGCAKETCMCVGGPNLPRDCVCPATFPATHRSGSCPGLPTSFFCHMKVSAQARPPCQLAWLFWLPLHGTPGKAGQK